MAIFQNTYQAATKEADQFPMYVKRNKTHTLRRNF